MQNLSQLSKKSKGFLRRSNHEKILFFRAFIVCGIARIIILLVPFNKIKRYIGKYNEESSFDIENSEYKLIKKIAWAVNSASGLTPWQSKCLVKALTAQIMLKKYNIYSTLYLGIAKDKEREIKAHAWLRCGSIILTGGHEMNNFKSIAKFSNEK